ncbi:hypothetical protein OC834_000766 [Tilletia horrida]|nr:hypothetical protein OC834_000766 [Tilletia horrida]
MDPATAEVAGIAPNKLMGVGDVIEVPGSGKEPYKLKRYDDHYVCSCPGWRFNKKGLKARTCKHLKALLGDKYEEARISAADPNGAATSSSSPTKRKATSTSSSSPSKKAKNTVELMLANTFVLGGGTDPAGWWMSEKLDGVRAYWDGSNMWSRAGNEYEIPDALRNKLPKDLQLDGELWMDRDAFDETSGIVRGGFGSGTKWESIAYMVFDVVGDTNPVEKRWAKLKTKFGEPITPTDALARQVGGSVIVLAQELCKSHEHLVTELKRVEALGGEGLMLRQPASQYEHRRSKALLKVKSFYDAEALVIAIEKGEGKNAGRMGALRCQMESGALFKVGTGFTDAHRNNPPPVGTIINYKFQELSHELTPRFPVFVGVAADKTKPKDAEVRSTQLRADKKAVANKAAKEETK